MLTPRRSASPIVAALATAIALALVAAGCGGSSNSPRDQLDAAFSRSTFQKLNSGVMHVDVKVQAGIAGTFDATLDGPFSKDGAALSLSVNGAGLGGKSIAFKGNLTATPDNLYLGLNGTTYELGTARFKQLQASGAQSSSTTPSNVKDACKQALEKAGKNSSACDKLDTSAWITNVTSGDGGTIDGVSTKSYSGQFDVQKAANDLLALVQAVAPQSSSSSLSPDQIAKQIESFIQSAKFSVDVGSSDGIPRKGNVTLSFGGPAAGASFAIDGTLSQVNKPQTISAPPGPILPIEQLRKKLPPALGKLFDCLLNAKDAAGLQACAPQATGGGGASLAPVS